MEASFDNMDTAIGEMSLFIYIYTHALMNHSLLRILQGCRTLRAEFLLVSGWVTYALRLGITSARLGECRIHGE